jgi:hypothetical protein
MQWRGQPQSTNVQQQGIPGTHPPRTDYTKSDAALASNPDPAIGGDAIDKAAYNDQWQTRNTVKKHINKSYEQLPIGD